MYLYSPYSNPLQITVVLIAILIQYVRAKKIHNCHLVQMYTNE